ncbi:MAG TPA: ribosomal RNA small subunit methyltransferase A [Firmicutes bacterium]|nr:ribosomal RNA small subunit methyltransferase A [Bacillota bacterium]
MSSSGSELNPASPRVLQELLRKYGIRPQKRLGQNFLVDQNVLRKITAAAEVTRADSVLEVGAGIGALTKILTEQAGMVTAVEKDRFLAPVLREVLGERENLRLVFADILRVDLQALFGNGQSGMNLKVVANIPYYITSPLIFLLLESGINWNLLVFLVQKEVAERIAAAPGSKKYGALTVGVRYHAGVELLGTVPPSVFFPRPQVSSAILRLVPKKKGGSVTTERLFKLLVRTVFNSRRKTLANALRKIAPELGGEKRLQKAFQDLGLDPGGRGEDLSVDEFLSLASYLTE